MYMVASIKIYTSGRSIRLIQLIHAIRVLGSPFTERRPVDTAMLTKLFVQLEQNVYTLETGTARKGDAVRSTDAGFFTSKDDVERERILDCMKLVCYEAGNTIFEQGQLSDGKFYFLLGGEVEIRIVDPQAPPTDPPTLLKIMSSGCSFGDRAMSSLDASRTARVRTVSDCVFGVLQRADFLRITRQFYDSAVVALECRAEERTVEHITLLENVLGDCAFFRALQFKTLGSGIVGSCTHKRVRKNELLFKEGDEAKCFYIVVRGHVRVVVGGDAVAVLGPGESFGELGVTGVTSNERRRTATIVGGAVPGVRGSPLEGECASPRSSSDSQLSRSSRRSELSYTDLAVISRDNYLRLQGRTDKAVARALREEPSHRTEEQIDLIHALCRATKFFRSIGSPLLEHKCCRYITMQTNAPGDVLFSEGDTGGDTFYIIIHGSVSGSIAATNKHFQLTVGDSFGDLALSGKTNADRVRSATIVCQEETMFATLSRVDYLRVTGALHKSALEVLNSPPEERSEADIHIVEGYLSEIQFFQDMHFPLLIQAVCRRLELRSLQAGQTLYDQGDASTGRYYMLLQGSMKQEAPQARVTKQYKTLTVPDCWGDSTNALHPDTGKALPATFFQCSRTITALPLQAGAPNQLTSLTIRVSGIADLWKAADVWELFSTFGAIASVHIRRRQGLYVEHRWADITFADRNAAERAAQGGGEALVRAVKARQEGHGDHSVVQDCIPSQFPRPELIRGTSGGKITLAAVGSSGSVDASAERTDTEVVDEEVLLPAAVASSDSGQRLEQADVLVACLSRDDFLQCCNAVITRVMEVLGAPPRNRSPLQIELVRTMISGTGLMQRVCSSSLVQRNCCRFLGISSRGTKETIFKRRQTADRCFIILTGRVDLYDGISEEPLERGPGAFLGDESVRSPDKETYEHEAVARSPVVLAVMSKADYFRICNTEAVQAVIDKFWQLGLANSKSADPSLLDFTGYKQIYLRLGKVIATKKMFSQKELRASMKNDWHSDLELFGDPELEALTHEQYTDSMYQFIDEWSQSVESTQLYEEMLQLILDNMTTVSPKTGDLVLLPLPKIQCCYQRVVDLCHTHERRVKAIVQGSTVGKLAIGEADHVSHFKQMFAQKGIFQLGHAVEETEGEGEALTVKEIIEREKSYIAEMFNSVDVDNSGSIDRAEVGSLSKKMGWDLTEVEMDAALMEMDPSGDGQVDFEEFTSWVRRYTEGDEMVATIFETVDADGSGVLDYEEVGTMLSELGVDAAHLDDAITAMDADGNGNVDCSEFISWWRGFTSSQVLEKEPDPVEEYYRRVFERADKDGNGRIDALELEGLLGSLGMPADAISLQLAMAVMDEDHDGVILWAEFKAWLDDIVATEIKVSEFCENSGVDTSRGGVLSFEKARDAIGYLCKQAGRERLDDAVLRARVFPPGIDTVSFEVLSTWWLAYQTEPDAQAGSVGEVRPSPADEAQKANAAAESEGGWDTVGGAGEIWTEGGWVSVGDFGHDESDAVGLKTKTRKKKERTATRAGVATPPRKNEMDAQLLADAEAAEERQRRRAKARGEQMLARRAQNAELRASSSRGSSRGSVRGSSTRSSAASTPSRQPPDKVDEPLDEFSDFTVKKQARPRTTEHAERTHMHSSSYRQLPTAPYLPHAAHAIELGMGRHRTAARGHHGLGMMARRQLGLLSQSMPDVDRPPSAEWKEREITIVPRGEDFVLRMPSVLTPAQVQKPRDEGIYAMATAEHKWREAEEIFGQRQAGETHQDESDEYREYVQGYLAQSAVDREEGAAHARFMDELYEHGLVVEHTKLALQQPHQQQRGSRAARTAAEREFYETVNWDYQGPSPRPSPRQRAGSPHSEPEIRDEKRVYGPSSPRHSSPREGGSILDPVGDGGTAERDRLELSIAGRQSPRHSPRTSDAVAAVARTVSPFGSPRSKAAAKAMLLDQAQTVSVLLRANSRRSTMRVPTAASIAPDLETRRVSPGAEARKAQLARRAKYKTPTERVDRNVLQWFAEHGSAKRSLKTMSRGAAGPQRKAFTRDWRSPPGCEWKLADTGGRASVSQADFRRLRHRPSTTGVLGSYGLRGGLSEQDCLWNSVGSSASASAVLW